ncbi:MAG: mechanosensitive ion channel family protein [Candidatus Thermoplasmatota archaeon]|nr:mechanosensitive ion channel family protein [Candidatus Thermoplasmatota archaeon]
MQWRPGTKAVFISAAVVLLILMSNPAWSQTIDEPIEVDDLQTLLEMYDPDTGRFGTIETGSFVTFMDRVSYVGTLIESEMEGGTEVSVEMSYLIMASTEERSEETYLLKFHGTDLKDRIDIGDMVTITVRISEHIVVNRSLQYIKPLSEMELVKGEGNDGVQKRTDIDVFGIHIPVSYIPEEYQTSFVRFLIVFCVWAAAALLIWGLVMVIVRISRRKNHEVDKEVFRIVTGPFFVIFLLYGILVSLSQFDLNPRLLDLLDMAYKGATTLFVAYILVKVFKKVIMVYLNIISKKTKTKADDVLVPIIGKLATVVIWIVAVIMFLRIFGIDITVFIAGMGIAGLVVALAAQDTLSNFFAGLMIMLDRPFKEGDWIEMEGITYQVRHIGLRSTRLFHTISNQIVTLPNNRISDHMFSNLSEPNFLGRKTVEVGVSYKHDPRKIGAMLLEIANSHPDALMDDDHQPFYRFNSFGDSSLNFAVTFWVKDFNDQWRVASEIREMIYDRFEKEGIEIPFPQRVLHMADKSGSKDQWPIADR